MTVLKVFKCDGIWTVTPRIRRSVWKGSWILAAPGVRDIPIHANHMGNSITTFHKLADGAREHRNHSHGSNHTGLPFKSSSSLLAGQ